MRLEDIKKKLPDEPGVYMFKRRRAKRPLYIGKATSIRDRVRSYFSSDADPNRGPRLRRMRAEADTVDYIRTDSVLEALILESEFIKRYKPEYNIRERDDKSYNYIGITNEPFPKVVLVRGIELARTPVDEFKRVFGPFPHGGELRAALKILRKIFTWRDSSCQHAQGRPCFARQIGLCPGVCTREINKKDYAFIIRNLSLFLSGKKRQVIDRLTQKMKRHARRREFEEAAGVRDKIHALTHIQDVALLQRKQAGRRGVRIESYDIAHIAGEGAVGALVVSEDGALARSEYRKFRIRRARGADDAGNLAETIRRRLSHPEWRYPDLIAVDGGRAQVNAAARAVHEAGLSMPVVGVVKDERHHPREIIGRPELVRDHKEELLLLNAEAHRFAQAYHKHLRGKAFVAKPKKKRSG